MARKKTIEEEIMEDVFEGSDELTPNIDQKELLIIRKMELENLYKILIDEGIRSISDLENKIANVNAELSKL